MPKRRTNALINGVSPVRISHKIICHCCFDLQLNFYISTHYSYHMVGNFRGYRFSRKQAKIQVSEIFLVLIFVVNLGPTG